MSITPPGAPRDVPLARCHRPRHPGGMPMSRILDRCRRSPRTSPRRADRHRLRPQLEACEGRQLLAVTYHGGPLLNNVGVETVYYGADWATSPTLRRQADRLDRFVRDITDSPYMD